ncbi:MAG: 16S rRNA processing protein RimM [Chitinivibrionales bacterium]|nr:16S rRNA processing protein RimM [Chitinivibrionales bacterium]
MKETIPNEERIALARVGKPVGLQGWCRLSLFGQTLNCLTPPVTLVAAKGEGSSFFKNTDRQTIPAYMTSAVGSGYREVTIEKTRYRNENEMDVLFRDYQTVEQVVSLNGFILEISRDQIPLLQDDEYYHFDLVGMKIITTEETSQQPSVIGVVLAVYNFPSVDALEVRLGNGKTVLIPFTAEIVGTVNRSNRTIAVTAQHLSELL